MRDGHDDVVRRLAAACEIVDTTALEMLLHSSAVAVCDSGGRVPAAVRPIFGADAVARLVLALRSDQPGTDLSVEAVNGRAGLVFWRAGAAVAVISVASCDGEAVVLWMVLNPEKLRAWRR